MAQTDFWDFTAKLPAGATKDQEPLYRATEEMLRTFLAQTFQLKTHFEKRDEPVYELIPAKGAPKLKPSDSAHFSSRLTPRGAEFRHTAMQQLANFLYCPNCSRQAADRPVFDKTGLTGTYDFTLNWSPSNLPDINLADPSIITAIQDELGLKLLPAKAPIDFLVIDHAKRPQQN